MKSIYAGTACAGALLVLIAAAFVDARPGGAAAERAEAGSGIPVGMEAGAWESIRPCEVYNYCREAASDRFAGRLTGHDGYTAAARWAAGLFAGWGLRPAGDDGTFLQEYPSPYTLVDSASMVLYLPREEGADTLTLLPGTDFLPQLFTASGSAEAGLVFAGWGISAPGLGYDDYDGIEVQGRFVVCFRGVPDREDERFEDHDRHTARMREARGRGALGLFYIYDDPIANPNGEWLEGFMPAIISEETAARLLEEKGLTPGELKSRLLDSGRPLSFGLSARVGYSVDSRHFPGGKGYNVVAYREGSSPGRGGGCIVAGAHFDHCGSHMGMVFPGANDNGSGSAVVMGIARAFSLLERAPGLPVVFVLFGGEEKGLEGSTWFAGNLPEAFDSVVVMLNFDMTGEGEGAGCAVTPEPPGLEDLLARADLAVGTLRRTRTIRHVGVRSSDFAPFFLGGAGCISFYSNGPHLHYHKTGDTVYRVNPEMLADVARLGFMSAWMLAGGEDRPGAGGTP